MNPRNLFAELKRRNVIRAVILYLGAVWALAQGISQLGPSVGAPEWATRWFLTRDFKNSASKSSRELAPVRPHACHQPPPGGLSLSSAFGKWQLRQPVPKVPC
jgi:hypothetical protein